MIHGYIFEPEAVWFTQARKLQDKARQSYFRVPCGQKRCFCDCGTDNETLAKVTDRHFPADINENA